MSVFKQTVLQLIGLWFRQKTRGNEQFLNQTKDQISYSSEFCDRNGEFTTPKVGAPFTGIESAERVVLASNKVIHHKFPWFSSTTSVDVETDLKIQKTIREQFVDKTVFVIAHRLNTIMGSDRIMVMDQVHVQELDSSANLLSNEQTAFNGLIRPLD
ncbi:MAG: hypothetical protein EZS28_016702 [Streblomastix strix]|uniref:Uncharacterized protein n=1 Tax=Streblomastix strix TaxID=222440 RepID=A0A5J4VZW1_9EUKA|nr:MAG: hypothetical protein EZS28_016702 [Streblomastix strix]